MKWIEPMLGRKVVIFLAVALALALAASAPLFAAQSETGKKRCTDGIDNDLDGLVDGADPDCNEGGGANGGGGGSEDPTVVTLLITVGFGDATFGDQVTSTIGPFDAVVECGRDFCEYHALPPPGGILYLPLSFADIIGATSFRGTVLDPYLCYNIDGNLKIHDLSHVFMRVYHDPSLYWHLSVNGWACDMDSTITVCSERQYEQRFRGGCYPSGCDRIDDLGLGAESHYYGYYLNTWSSGPNQKLGTACICTKSNSPDCPDDVGFPIPPATVKVKRMF